MGTQMHLPECLSHFKAVLPERRVLLTLKHSLHLKQSLDVWGEDALECLSFTSSAWGNLNLSHMLWGLLIHTSAVCLFPQRKVCEVVCGECVLRMYPLSLQWPVLPLFSKFPPCTHCTWTGYFSLMHPVCFLIHTTARHLPASITYTVIFICFICVFTRTSTSESEC